MNYALLIPAAGKGERFGGETPKTLVLLSGKPLIWWVVEAFKDDGRLQQIVIAASSEAEQGLSECLTSHPLREKVKIVRGGTTRQDSVGNALAAVTLNIDCVLVHDSARPLVTREVIGNVLAGLQTHIAAVPGIPITDTVKRVSPDGTIAATLTRAELAAVQTPQGVRFREFLDAHKRARLEKVQCTDDVALIEHFALGPVLLVAGDPRNLKITLPHELLRAESILRGDETA